MKITHKKIREYLGHDGETCKVVIRRDGTIKRHGSPDPFDRSRDFWHGCGTVDEIKQQMRDEMNRG